MMYIILKWFLLMLFRGCDGKITTFEEFGKGDVSTDGNGVKLVDIPNSLNVGHCSIICTTTHQCQGFVMDSQNGECSMIVSEKLSANYIKESETKSVWLLNEMKKNIRSEVDARPSPDRDSKSEDGDSDDQVGDNQTGDKHSTDNQVGDNQAGDTQATDSQAGDNQAGDNQAGDSTDNQAGDNQAGDSNATDSQTKDNQTGDNQTEGNQAGDNQAGDEQTGDNQAGDNHTGDNQASDDNKLVCSVDPKDTNSCFMKFDNLDIIAKVNRLQVTKVSGKDINECAIQCHNTKWCQGFSYQEDIKVKECDMMIAEYWSYYFMKAGSKTFYLPKGLVDNKGKILAFYPGSKKVQHNINI